MMDLRNCFLTSAQSGMTMEPKTIFIIAAVVLAIVFLILWQKEREKSKRAPYTPPSPPDPIRRETTVPTTPPAAARPARWPSGRPRRSLRCWNRTAT